MGRYSDQTKSEDPETQTNKEEAEQKNTTADQKDSPPPQKEISPEDNLKKQIEQAEKDIKTYKEQYIMTMAEAENTRKQTRAKVELTKEQQLFDFSKTLLEFNDQLNSLTKTANPEA